MASYSKKCFAVMSNDNDFLIFPCVSRYIPFGSLWQKANEDVECHAYTPKRTAQKLGVSVDLLPYFSCIVGNDYTSTLLTDSHFRFLLKTLEKGGRRPKGSVSHLVIQAAAKFIGERHNNKSRVFCELFERCSGDTRRKMHTLLDKAERKYRQVEFEETKEGIFELGEKKDKTGHHPSI